MILDVIVSYLFAVSYTNKRWLLLKVEFFKVLTCWGYSFLVPDSFVQNELDDHYKYSKKVKDHKERNCLWLVRS